jgi:hypothetical protein
MNLDILPLSAIIRSSLVFLQNHDRSAETIPSSQGQPSTHTNGVHDIRSAESWSSMDVRQDTRRSLTPSRSLEAGAWSIQGRRDHQEDTYLLSLHRDHHRLFGVFDGHGGALASYVCAQNMKRNFVYFHQHYADVGSCLIRAFAKTESDYKNSPDPFIPSSPFHFPDPISRLRAQGREGCTAVVAYVDKSIESVTVANAGDSRCVLCTDEGVIPLTVDHKPSLDEERNRILYYGLRLLLLLLYRHPFFVLRSLSFPFP